MSARISKEELSLFEKLHNKRLDALKVLSTRPFRGVWKNVIDQYPESAHFIYELLQNANDAKASYVRINITKEGVIFIHNGTIQFSITSSEDEEKENRKVGHINSITSIGASSKDGLNTIGKFGIGFKSVFSYTDTPYIYDDKFWFRIDNYIVPTLLDKDFEGRNEGETLFWLPFKSNGRERCYNEIANKIRKLDNPILFLDIIESIEWIDEPCNESSQYTKTIECSRKFKGTQGELLRVNNSGEQYKIWMFHRSVLVEGVKKAQRISVGYYVKEVDGRDVIDTNANPKVFCYFPTSEKFNQKRIMHAPFLLTASRSELREDTLNDFLMRHLAKLSADSLVYLRDIGLKHRNILIDNNLFDLISLPRFGRGYISYGIWVDEYTRVIKKNELLLTQAGKYTSITNAIIARQTKLREVVNDKQLTALLGSYKPLYFVCSQIKSGSNEWEYLTRTLGISVFDYNRFAETITADFMNQQSDTWLHRFYKHLNDSNDRMLFKESPIIRTNKGEFVAPYQGGILNVFRASAKVDSDKYIVDSALIKKRTSKELFEKFGIRELKPIDQIEAIRIKYQKSTDIVKEELYADTYYICDLYLHSKKATQDSIVSKLANELIVSSLVEGNEILSRIGKIYDKNIALDNYFRGNLKGYVTLNYEFYEPLFKAFDKERVLDLFYRIGLKREPIFALKKHMSINELPDYVRLEIQRNPASYGYEIEEFEMQGLEYALSNNLSKELSLKIWRWLGDALNDGKRWDELVFSYFYYTNKKGKTKSSMFSLLTNTRWIYIEGKPRNTPNKFTRQQMREAGYVDNKELFNLLGVKSTWEDSILIPDDVKHKARIGEQFADYTEEERIEARRHLEKERQRKLQTEQINDDEWWGLINSEEQDDSDSTIGNPLPRIVSSDTRAEEGRQTLEVHLKRERSPMVTKKFKQFKAQIDRDLKCEVCGFSFRRTYGKLGAGYAEAHHIRPISECQESIETTFDDLCIVCANCHRMLHKTILGRVLSIEDLKKIIKR